MYQSSIEAYSIEAYSRNLLITNDREEDRKVSKQYRGAGLAQGKAVSVGTVPRLTGKLGLLKEGLESVEAVSRHAR